MTAGQLAGRPVERIDPAARRRAVAVLAFIAALGLALALALVATQRGVIGVALGLAALGAVLAMARPSVATYVVVAILYSNAAAVAVRFHGLPYFAGLAFPLLLIMPLAYELIVHRRTVVITPPFRFLFVFLIVQLIGAAMSRDVRLATEQIQSFLVAGIGLYLLLTNVVRDLPTLRNVVWIVLLVGAGLGSLSIFQTITGDYHDTFYGFAQVNFPGSGTTDVTDGTQPRLTGPIGEVNRYAQVMLALVPIGALMALGERRPLHRLLLIGMTLLILAGMASTASRGAALGFAGVIAGGMAFRYVRLPHLVVIAVVAVMMLAAFPRLGDRLVNLQAITGLDRGAAGTTAGDAGNLRSRATESLAALIAFADHPIVGVGPGLFPTYYQEYAREVATAGFDARIDLGTREAHSLYTQILAENGVIGFGALMAFVLATGRELLRARRRWLPIRPANAHLASGMVLSILGVMLSSITLHLSFERYFYFLFALAGVTAFLLNRLPLPADDGDGTSATSSPAPSRAALPARAGEELRPSPAAR